MYDLLEGLRIVEGSAFVAAPLGGMALGQLGADVIRFDALEGGLDYRRWPVTDKGDSIYWAGLNKGKRSFRVDIRSPRGRELVQALIAAPGPDGGIFLTNLPARGWIGYEALSALRADLILLNVLGTRSGAPQVDYTVNASVGFPYVTGPEGWEGPVDNVLPAWDIATGMLAAAGLLAARAPAVAHGRRAAYPPPPPRCRPLGDRDARLCRRGRRQRRGPGAGRQPHIRHLRARFPHRRRPRCHGLPVYFPQPPGHRRGS